MITIYFKFSFKQRTDASRDFLMERSRNNKPNPNRCVPAIISNLFVRFSKREVLLNGINSIERFIVGSVVKIKLQIIFDKVSTMKINLCSDNLILSTLLII